MTKTNASSCCLFSILLISLCLGCNTNIQTNTSTKNRSTEILYHVCQRSFYDSNGDQHGDINGLRHKLDYLQELGVTSILLLPLYESVFYHNYFPISFENIDPEFGTKADYFELVEEVHDRDMKIYMDMEIHYITEDHIWFKDSYKNPDSEFSQYIIYNDSLNERPESIIWDLKELTGYDGTAKKVMTLNLYNPECKKYIYDLFKYWLDPNQDGDFRDGVDGYRIDHMMDDLDWKKGLIPDMFTKFWKPLFDELRTINPDITIMGEQAEWDDYGGDYFEKGDVDWMFAFGAKSGINNFDKNEIITRYDSAFAVTPKEKNQIIFIENHDVTRFATKVESDLDKMKVGAAFNLLLEGIPSIYYGQEIGMQGLNNQYKNIDGNHIPLREAFEWYKEREGPGMTYWYRDTGPWWTNSTLKDYDGISYEEQKGDENSLWFFYKKFIELRKSNTALAEGDLSFIENENENVVSFTRASDVQELVIHINLSDEAQEIQISKEDLNNQNLENLDSLIGQVTYSIKQSKMKFELGAYDILVLKITS